MIKIEHLSKVFRTEEVETTALNDVSLHVKQGEFVAIMGPSGCGKSTLLNIIGLLDNPTSGDYYFNGQEVGHLKEKQHTRVRKGNIGFVFQSFNLIDELNVYENVELPLIYLKKKASEKKERVRGTTTAGCHCPCRRGRAQADPCRRADRKPRFQKRGGSHEPVDRAEPRGNHHCHGDPLPARCLLRPPGDPSL